MIEYKIEKLIEEVFNNNDPQRYVYYYSSIKFPEIRINDDRGLDNSKYFNAMLAPISPEWIQRFRSNGFKAWGNGPIYEYKIDILKNQNSFIVPLGLLGVPEENREFKKGIWANHVRINGNKNEEEYRKMLDKFTRAHYGYLTPETYVNSSKIKHILDNWNQYLDKNFRYGDKKELATFIPRLSAKIRKPIIPESITKII